MAAAGASAALAGLVFVAISINLERILELDGVPELGLVTILLLIGVLIVSLFGLIPDQDHQALGLELLLQGLVFSTAIGWLSLRSVIASDGHYGSRIMLPLCGTTPFLVGSVLLLAGSAAGPYWIFAGLIGAILAAVLNAWILLVEILR
ncbi:MAG: hypothetical protein M9938_06010 [Solirubrobacterales bacterium]|nr:hypothetical protein [Solirubrobacterales bacterium]